jgi:putative endonuclease
MARSRGSAAETLAACYLELSGMEVVARNRRVAGVEIDLVAVDGNARVLVEVKYRGRSDYGGAALAVDFRQRERLARAARAVAAESGSAVRIDVVAIELGAEGLALRHYRNAVTD